MQIVQMVYKSVAAPGLSEADMLDILGKSQSANLQRKISGLLICRNGRFIQLLEGSEAAVSDLFERISRDPRHAEVTLVCAERAARPAMPTWAMAYFSPTLAETGGARPSFVLSDEAARQVCRELPAAIAQHFLEALAD